MRRRQWGPQSISGEQVLLARVLDGRWNVEIVMLVLARMMRTACGQSNSTQVVNSETGQLH